MSNTFKGTHCISQGISICWIAAISPLLILFNDLWVFCADTKQAQHCMAGLRFSTNSSLLGITLAKIKHISCCIRHVHAQSMSPTSSLLRI